MKRLTVVLIAMMFAGVLSAQLSNTFKYVIKAKAGIINTKQGLAADKVDSTKISAGAYKLYQGATQLIPDIPAGAQALGVALADSDKVTVGNYVTSEQLASFVAAFRTNTVRKILSSNEKIDNTGNTNENTIYTGTIPGGSIGANGSFHIIALLSYTNSASAKTFKIKFAGTDVGMFYATTSAIFRGYWTISNRNNVASQISFNNGTGSGSGFYSTSASAVTTSTFNTAADITVTITAHNADGAEHAAVEAFEILAVY